MVHGGVSLRGVMLHERESREPNFAGIEAQSRGRFPERSESNGNKGSLGGCVEARKSSDKCDRFCCNSVGELCFRSRLPPFSE